MGSRIFKRGRPSIGVLTGRAILEGTPGDNYRVSVMRGIQSAARRQECHLFLSWGIRRITDINRIYPAWPIVSADSDFISVGPWNMDGLIVFTPLGDEHGSQYLQALMAEGYPIMFVATGEQGPTISVDNTVGIRQAMTHLVEHGHRSIAFIAGIPSDAGDSTTRLQAYREVVADYGLETDPRLVEWGWHYIEEGYKAMRRLLASGVKFSAVLASNDNSAVGAMQAIREAGLRIPADIAIIGFDDQPIGRAQVPPLSSIHVPLTMMGELLVGTMLDHLIRQMPLQSVQIPTRLIRRQSCGCVPESVSVALDGVLEAPPGGLRRGYQYASLQEAQKHVVHELLKVLPAEPRSFEGDQIRKTCTILVEAFCRSLDENTLFAFQTAFIDCIHELEMIDGSIELWQDIISVLRREMIALPLKWERVETRQLADNLLHLARVVVGESAERQDRRHQYRRTIQARKLNALTASLSAAVSERQAIGVMYDHLASVGIRHARVMFFEAEQDDPVAWSVVIDAEAVSPPWRFLSRQFPPPGLFPEEELFNLVLLPLVFQNEVFGYLAIEASDLDACAVIAIQLAATIKVSRLHAQIVELSLTDALTGLQNRRSFELFLKNEVSRSQRFSRSMAVILVDVDRFKDYNDTYGHPAGDEALQRVAKCLSNARRNADIVARIGGDEFAIILPESDVDGALEVSRRIRAMVAVQLGLMRAISVSIGVTLLLNPEMDAESLIKQADTALYESKRNGRNRISIYDAQGVFDEQKYTSQD